EGVNGLAVHVFNDGAAALAARVELTLYRAGEIRVGHAASAIHVPAHAAIEIAASALFEGFADLSFAYRFGPAMADVVHAVLFTELGPIADAFWFPTGQPSVREADVGLAAVTRPGADMDERILEVSARRYAQSVTISASGFVPDDNGFHLAPGQTRTIVLRAHAPSPSSARGTVSALNGEATARFSTP
ncbi:MAG: glycoside hydrolase family 2 protein, partial [Rhodanobacter sp.]